MVFRKSKDNSIIINTNCQVPYYFQIKVFLKKLNVLFVIFRSKYGKNHPLFIKALLYYGYFSNEFIQDESTVFLAKVSF